MRSRNEAAFEVGGRRAEQEFDSKLESIVRSPIPEEIQQQALGQVGLVAWLHSISPVETMRAAAIILNEALILGYGIFGR